MEEVKFRNAILDDLTILYDFEQGIITAERPFNQTLKSGHINYYDLKKMILSNETDVIVGVIGNEIICSANICVKKARPYLNHEYYAYVGFMYVKPEFRGKGINQKIIKELKTWAELKGLNEIRLTVYDDNFPAIRAYEKAGLEKHIIEMRMGIDKE